MKAVSKDTPAVVFRNNTGMAWQGDVQKTRDGSILIRNPRPIHAGLIKGASDMIGFTTVTVTSEMVGQKVALFTALEAKTGKLKATPEQLQFIKVVQDSGGIAAIVRSEADALNAILSRIKALNSQIKMQL